MASIFVAFALNGRHGTAVSMPKCRRRVAVEGLSNERLRPMIEGSALLQAKRGTRRPECGALSGSEEREPPTSVRSESEDKLRLRRNTQSNGRTAAYVVSTNRLTERTRRMRE